MPREVNLIHPDTILLGDWQNQYDTEQARVAMAGVLSRIVRRELVG